MTVRCLALTVVLATYGGAAVSSADRTAEIIRRSVANTNADWAAAPQFDFTEKDVTTHGGEQTVKTYQVLMIDGSPYNKLTAMDGRPLSPERKAEEERKLQAEIARRHSESASERQKRVSEYEKERHQDHAMLVEMTKAFNFKLSGEETVNGHRCYVLEATPKAGYKPPTRETEVLPGMRGKMWVDEQQYRWVKVHAEVFRPVTFGLFIARVKPGTAFTLEEQPVQGNLWLPSHFSMELQARILIFSRHSKEDETYSNYHRAADLNAGIQH